MMSTVWYSLLSFTLICTWHFLYIDIWLSFSWPAHFDRAYNKVLNIDACAQKWKNCKRDFQVLILRLVYEFLWSFLIICVQFHHLQKVSDQFNSEDCQVSFWWLFLTFHLCHSEMFDWLYSSHVINETLSSCLSMFWSQSFVSSFLIMQCNILVR